VPVNAVPILHTIIMAMEVMEICPCMEICLGGSDGFLKDF